MQYHPHQKALSSPTSTRELAGARGASIPATVRSKRWESRRGKEKKTPQIHQNRPLLFFRFHGDTIDNTVTVRIIVRGVGVAAEASGK